MKDFVNRAISLGLGIVVESKEQIEKLVDELVKKGELSKGESTAVVNEIMEKGEVLRKKLDNIIQEKMNLKSIGEGAATKEEIQQLEARIAKLEEILHKS